jgi:hypothetical protein
VNTAIIVVSLLAYAAGCFWYARWHYLGLKESFREARERVGPDGDIWKRDDENLP